MKASAEVEEPQDFYANELFLIPDCIGEEKVQLLNIVRQIGKDKCESKIQGVWQYAYIMNIYLRQFVKGYWRK